MKKLIGFAILGLFVIGLNSCKKAPTSPVPSGPTFSLRVPFIYSQLTGGVTEGAFNLPSAVAVDSKGNIYVGDTGNNRIVVYSSQGVYLTQFPLQFVFGLTVDGNDNVFAVSNSCSPICVRELILNGSSLISYEVFFSENGNFSGPVGVAFDSSNNFYIADSGNNLVKKFSFASFTNYDFVTQWYAPHPDQLTVDGSGNVFVACSGNESIKKFDSNGNLLKSLDTPTPPYFQGLFGVEVDSSDIVYLGDSSENAIYQLNSNLQTYNNMGLTPGVNIGQVFLPRGLYVDKNRNLYIADSNNNRIEIIKTPYNFSGLTTFGIFPNPVKSPQDADFAFVLSNNLNFSVTIKDSLGNLVNQYQGQGVQGDNILEWNMTANGGLVDPGVYYVTYQSGSTQSTQTLSYVR